MFAVYPPKYANRAWSHSKRALFFSCSSRYSLLVQEQFQETGEYEKDEERAACDGGSTCSYHPLCRPTPAQSSSHKLAHQTEEKDAPVASGITDASLAYHLQNAKVHGVTKEEIAAIITHATMYTGWPKGWIVFRLAKDV